ncbi:MAG TPA: SH3 domain-containing protein [Thermomicrobiales bacterium]|nr:SH3 domain-containing protein [Thermomicrobiales bacterium]
MQANVHRSIFRIDGADGRRDIGVRALGVALALALALLALPGRETLAEAPPLAIGPYAVQATNTPSPDSRVVADIPANTQVELTGRAAPGFIEIEWNGETAWIPAQYLEVSNKIGMNVATAATDLTILTAPNPSGDPRATVPAGGSIILTGARVNGYVAMSYNGTGGWVPASGLE